MKHSELEHTPKRLGSHNLRFMGQIGLGLYGPSHTPTPLAYGVCSVASDMASCLCCPCIVLFSGSSYCLVWLGAGVSNVLSCMCILIWG